MLPPHSLPLVASLTLVVLLLASCSDTADDSADTTLAATTTTTAAPTTTTTAAPTTTTAPLLTIMPIGDSITSGKTGWSTYRCYLDGMLNDAGVSFDFVGRISSPYPGKPYGCATVFDQDHEGWWGKRVDEVIDDVTASVEVLQPAVALIHLGSNDLYWGEGPASTAEELESLITGLQEVSPDITILVAQIIPCAPGPAPEFDQCSDDWPAFNDAIASFASLSTDESSVIVVDMETGFSLSDLRDQWHPTDAGDEVIASRWMTALQEAGVI
jgi:acyl-CoA thioesterase-1